MEKTTSKALHLEIYCNFADTIVIHTKMDKIITKIQDIDKNICKNIKLTDSSERGLLSQNILSQLRNFVEHISLKVWKEDSQQEIDNSYPNIQKAIQYINSKGNLAFLSRFHKLLQISSSHYTLDEGGSERLMLKYYEYLIKIKDFLKQNYGLDVLQNINDFPIQTDSNLKEYYEKIAEKINQPSSKTIDYEDRFYIQKVKPFFINLAIYYEITFRRANDYASKFDRIIAFTKKEILDNYAVKLSIRKNDIEILGKRMPIQIIENWEVSIRPCEIDNFARIIGISVNNRGNDAYELMKYLTESKSNLIEIIDLDDFYYNSFKNSIIEKTKSKSILELLDLCRNISKNRCKGHNVIRYLLLHLNNKIIKNQFENIPNKKLSNLNLNFGCIPFDEMPYNSSLLNHNPKLGDLFESIDFLGRDHELLARRIKNNTENKGQLYTSIDEIENFENIEDLVRKWNNNLYYNCKHQDRRIEIHNGHLYIRGYEEKVVKIIRKIKEFSCTGVKNYTNSVTSWLNSSSYTIDCEEKEKAIKEMFEQSKVALIYGSAGTGKTTLINHIYGG